jgi:hypothetical protein
MSTRPAFQFYPSDWHGNAKLQRCSLAARGAWMEILCILHDSDEYGVIRWPLCELADAAHVPLKVVEELVRKGVLKGADDRCPAYIHTPRHAGKDGEPVTLVKENSGPCWYSSRFVRDEWRRGTRGGETRFSAENQPDRAPPEANQPGHQTPHQPDHQPDGMVNGSVTSEVTALLSSTSSSSSKNSIGEIELNSERVVAHSKKQPRGTRWPPDQAVPPDWIQAAGMKRAERGLPPIDLPTTAEMFSNYWASKSGRDATKVDWRMTWMNWMLKENPRPNGNGAHNGQGRRTSAHDKFLNGAAAYIRGLETGPPEIEDDSDALSAPRRPLLPS